MENQEKQTEKKEVDKSAAGRKNAAYLILLQLGTEFAFIIAVPLITFIYLGRKLDARMQTKYFVVVGILLATFLSGYMIYKKINQARNLLK